MYFLFGCSGSLLLLYRLSLVAARGGCSLAAVHGLLVQLASLVAEDRLLGLQASAVVFPRLQSTGSTVVLRRLSCSMACGIFLDQGLNPCLLHWQMHSLPLSHQASSIHFLYKPFFAKIYGFSYENRTISWIFKKAQILRSLGTCMFNPVLVNLKVRYRNTMQSDPSAGCRPRVHSNPDETSAHCFRNS